MTQTLIPSIPVGALAREFGTPLYVYDWSVIKDNVERIQDSVRYRPFRIHYACMANANVHLLRELKNAGVGAFVSSPGELAVAVSAGFSGSEIVVNCANLTATELTRFAQAGVTVNADSPRQVMGLLKSGYCGPLGLRAALALRGLESKAGIGSGGISRLGMEEAEMAKCIRQARASGIKAFGLHMYAGTCISRLRLFVSAIDRIMAVAESIENLQFLDIGGGFGIPYASSQRSFPWTAFGEALTSRMQAAAAKRSMPLELKMEPGRSIVGSAGVLLTRVTDIKQRHETTFVGVDTSFSNFARTYIYRQPHRIILASRPDARPQLTNVTITGNIVLGRDVFATGLKFPRVKEGDVLAILDVGAYGYTMSSHFCGRMRPAEVLIKDGSPKLIRTREVESVLL